MEKKGEKPTRGSFVLPNFFLYSDDIPSFMSSNVFYQTTPPPSKVVTSFMDGPLPFTEELEIVSLRTTLIIPTSLLKKNSSDHFIEGQMAFRFLFLNPSSKKS